MNTQFLHPRYWLTWLGLALLHLIVFLPWKIQMSFGHGLGLLMFYLLKKRRSIACINLDLSFPNLNKEQRNKLLKQHFISLGKSVFETPIAWWGKQSQLKKRKQVNGFEHLQEAINQNKGIVLLSAHFTSLELGGRLLAMDLPLHVIYRPHQNILLDTIVANARSKQYGRAISKNNIRAMIQSLKQGNMIWYAQDQNPKGLKNRVYSPFFDVPIPTNTALSRIAKISGAAVIPFFTIREKEGYRLIFLPALKNFPSGDELADANLINHTIEEQIRKYPDQYLWVHKRFRDTPDGGNRYEQYTGSC